MLQSFIHPTRLHSCAWSRLDRRIMNIHGDSQTTAWSQTMESVIIPCITKPSVIQLPLPPHTHTCVPQGSLLSLSSPIASWRCVCERSIWDVLLKRNLVLSFQGTSLPDQRSDDVSFPHHGSSVQCCLVTLHKHNTQRHKQSGERVISTRQWLL